MNGHLSKPIVMDEVMKTIARKSTPSKCRRIRSPFCGRQSIVRVYQRNSSGSNRRPTPDSALSIANGTRIFPDHAVGRPGVLVTLVTA